MVTPGEVDPPESEEDDDGHDDAMPRVHISRKNLALFVFFVVSAVAFLYFVLPQISGLEDSWNRIEDGDPLWLGAAALFTAGSFGGYVLLFQGVFVTPGSKIDFRASYQITMAGLAATRLFAAGGAGGIALTAWALRRSGMSRRNVADKTLAFLALTYVVYAAALIVVGLGMYAGLFPGSAPFSITMVPAIFGAICFVIAGLMIRVPPDLQRRVEKTAAGGGRMARTAQRLAAAPAASSAGLRLAIAHVRRRDPAVIGAILYWGGNLGVLWACFHAFGEAPPWSVIVMAFFVGFLGNLLPLPGGIGGVDGGMIGMFVAFDVDLGLATVAVLTYRAFAFWLPTIPGAIAYFQLRRTVARWSAERSTERTAKAAAAPVPG